MYHRSLLVALALAIVCGSPTAAASPDAAAAVGSRPQEPTAGSWQTYILTSGSEIFVPVPPRPGSAETKAELDELVALQASRTAAVQSAIATWDAAPAFGQWTSIELDLIRTRGTNTPRAMRALALVHATVYDAVIATWHWKYSYHRPDPTQLSDQLIPAVRPSLAPSYPSEHAVIAGAASRMLAHLFPADAAMLESRAQEAGFSRLQAGVSYRSDMEAGLALGRAVADTAITRRALTDGAAASWDPVTQPGRLTGPGFWKPTAPAFAFPPTTPLAGSWRTWVIGSEFDYLPIPPPGFTAGPAATIDTSVLLGVARTVVSEGAATRALDAEGQRRRDVVAFWAGAPGDRWNRIALELIRRDQLNLPRAARISALVNVAGADAIDSSWKAKFTYWTARPQTIIQDYIDPTWLSYRPTPSDPSYSSGLATVSGAGSEVLAFFFPADAQMLRGRANDAMLSRLYDGSHWPHDNHAGYAAGLAMAPRFIARAQADGARPPL